MFCVLIFLPELQIVTLAAGLSTTAHLWRREAVYRKRASQQYISMSSFLVPVPPSDLGGTNESPGRISPCLCFCFHYKQSGSRQVCEYWMPGRLFGIPASVTVIHSSSTARSCLRLYANQPAQGSSPSQPPLRTLHCAVPEGNSGRLEITWLNSAALFSSCV